jgi:hypothetical protein
MPPSTTCLLTALITTFGLAGSAEGQVRVVRHGDDRLVGIREVDVVVRTSGAGDDECAVVRDAVARAAAESLRDAGVRATVSGASPSWYHSLLITVATAPAPCGCSSAVVIDLVAHVRGIPDADASVPPDAWGNLLVGHMPLATTTDVATASAAAHQHALEQIVRARAAALAARMRAQSR